MANPAENAEGPLVIGIFINAVLLGVMSTQVYLYYTSFKNDRLWVAFLFVCDIANTVFDIAALYQTLIQHFGDFIFLGEITWLFDTDPALTGIIVTSTQLLFAWRIYALTKRRILSLLIVAFTLVGGVSAVVTAVKIADAPMFALLAKVRVPIVVGYPPKSLVIFSLHLASSFTCKWASNLIFPYCPSLDFRSKQRTELQNRHMDMV